MSILKNTDSLRDIFQFAIQSAGIIPEDINSNLQDKSPAWWVKNTESRGEWIEIFTPTVMAIAQAEDIVDYMSRLVNNYLINLRSMVGEEVFITDIGEISNLSNNQIVMVLFSILYPHLEIDDM